MKYFYKLKLIFCLYALLIMSVSVFFGKVIYDFCSTTKDIEDSFIEDVHVDKIIIKPRVQSYENGFIYMESDDGYLNYNNYVFNNVKIEGYFGTITAGKLKIKNNKNIFEFTKKPKFTINIDEI